MTVSRRNKDYVVTKVLQINVKRYSNASVSNHKTSESRGTFQILFVRAKQAPGTVPRATASMVLRGHTCFVRVSAIYFSIGNARLRMVVVSTPDGNVPKTLR